MGANQRVEGDPCRVAEGQGGVAAVRGSTSSRRGAGGLAVTQDEAPVLLGRGACQRAGFAKGWSRDSPSHVDRAHGPVDWLCLAGFGWTTCVSVDVISGPDSEVVRRQLARNRL